MIRIEIKPISQNRALKGRKFKTREYHDYERSLMLILPKLTLPSGPYFVFFEFGLNRGDYDNPLKSTQDIICARYGFDDSLIVGAKIRKIKVKKGMEYIKFKIESYIDKDSDVFFNQ